LAKKVPLAVGQGKGDAGEGTQAGNDDSLTLDALKKTFFY